MTLLEALDAAAVRLWSRTAVESLNEHRREIDALNVFPVPDADTGSNTLTTVRAGDDALATAFAADPGLDVATALNALAGGAAGAALGNSGFIVSQILRGFADCAPEPAAGVRDLDAAAVCAGLAAGARLARSAVVTPVEGTILTVAAAAAAAAAEEIAAEEIADPGAGTSLARVVLAAVRAADAALQRTPSQLADLAQAGVVDAGGRALVVLLDALARVITGETAGVMPVHAPLRSEQGEPPPVSNGFAFEVQYLLDAPAAALDRLRSTLAALGDSVAVVGAGTDPATNLPSWNVHVHVDDVGAAIEAGIEAGRPRGITVVRFAETRDSANSESDDLALTAVLAVAPGAGLAHLFESEGVHVVEGGADDLPQIADVVAAIRGTGARAVVLLPNASRVKGVAEAAAEQARAHDIRVAVVPTRSPVQGLAAIAVHDSTRRFDDDVVAMAEAAAATRWAELTVVRDEALTAVGICKPGDVLGMIDGEVVDIGRGLLAVAFGIVDRLLAVGAELITIVIGEDAPHRSGELLEAHVRGRSPFTDVAVYQGGQPDQPVIIGVE